MIKDVTENKNFRKKILQEEDVVIDPRELIIGGHSFGGMTALYTSTRLEKDQLKAVWVFDPWMYPLKKEWASGSIKLKHPTLIINSELFHPDVLKHGKFDSWQLVKDVVQHSEARDKTENLVIRDSGHWH